MGAAKKLVVVGLGNRLMSDEGIGSILVEQMETNPNKPSKADFVDAGTGGISLLHCIAGRRKAIIVDCARMNSPAGTIKKFRPEQAKTEKHLSDYCLHEADVLKIVSMSRQLDESPDDVVIFGIEPEQLSPGCALSPTLSARIKEYKQAVLAEINE